MSSNRYLAEFAIAALLSLAIPACGEVKVTVDRNVGKAATKDFKFENVPSPAKDNAAAQANLVLVEGEGMAN